MHPYVTLSL
ncbi:hypothetical protein FQN60_007934 [Etheostoma spectabile]|uniref:Uncharacterized protein n=1 Tax=Etheostoma spectabile TaxID=54343 RepID=A0A5J5C7M8_9PERO|nr:hypothetical protein FQN60_007934 [Etheostoma spectabile]